MRPKRPCSETDSGRNVTWTRWSSGKMTKWRKRKLSKWYMNKSAKWQIEECTKRLVDEKSIGLIWDDETIADESIADETRCYLLACPGANMGYWCTFACVCCSATDPKYSTLGRIWSQGYQFSLHSCPCHMWSREIFGAYGVPCFYRPRHCIAEPQVGEKTGEHWQHMRYLLPPSMTCTIHRNTLFEQKEASSYFYTTGQQLVPLVTKLESFYSRTKAVRSLPPTKAALQQYRILKEKFCKVDISGLIP